MIWRRLLPRPAGGPWPQGEPADAARLVVLEEGATPSGDYILHPWLAQLGVPVLRLDSRLAPRTGQLQRHDYVVVLRYLPAAWRAAIARQRGELSGLAWFLDDDLLDPQALVGLPPAYARKLSELALRLRPWFEQQAAAWWFATPALGAKYAHLSPRVLPLAPPPELRQANAGSVRLAYHGSASHQAELDWLHPVLAEVQSRCSCSHIELIGDLAVNRRFRDLPRVTVLHPLRWDNYHAHTASQRADIGLAPLLPSAFNAGRGAVKFFDYGRMGAFGLYSDCAPYAGFVRDGVDGLLLPNEPEAWVQALLALVADAPRRAALAQAVAQRLADAG